MEIRERVRARRWLIVVLGVWLAPVAMLGQDAPFDGGPAEVRLGGPAQVQGGGTMSLDVIVDLTGMTGTCGQDITTAVLNGYTIPVGFDSNTVTYLGADACNDPYFSSAPTATDAITANALGEVTITSTQTDATAPTGEICVARLRFDVGTTTGMFEIEPDQPLALASALQNCPSGGTGGPGLIPATGSAFTFAITNPVPMMDEWGLVVFVLLIAGVGHVVLKQAAGSG